VILPRDGVVARDEFFAARFATTIRAKSLTLELLYHVGEGAKQDFEEAARLYEMAAEQGCRHAQYNLAVMYDRGEGLNKITPRQRGGIDSQ
jgi:hypothetical protein